VKILILNRRDLKHPEGGGAEVYTHEIARSFQDKGARVTIFCSGFAGALADEYIDGIRHLRRGNEFTVHFHGYCYAFRHRQSFDLIIDEFNGLGFFCFLLPRSMILIHQLYRGFWFRELGPFGAVPYIIEPLLLRCYRKKPAVTVSDSTRRDLEGMGFLNIHVVMNALSIAPLPLLPDKEELPTLVFLGRLKSTKKPEDALTIFRKVKAELPETRLWIIGRGPEEKNLQKLAMDLPDVTFYGWVPDDRKFDLLRRAHILLVPGVREGFGINVIEAASQGTPAIGYDVHGLRDSIRNGLTGMLANDPEDASVKILALLKSPSRYRAMQEQCLAYAKDFNWQKRGEEFWEVIRHYMTQ
jgi:glycosyltransferase involved in cell wall biosynthesis